MRSRNIAAAVVLAGVAGLGLMPMFASAAPLGTTAVLATNAAERAAAVSPPVIDAPAAVTASTDQPISINAAATDPDATEILTITASGAPASLTLSHVPSVSPASASLTGTLVPGDEGSHAIMWHVSDGIFSASTTTNLTVNANQPPVVDAPATAIGAETVAFTLPVTVTDPDGDNVSSITAAPVPAGATFTPNGFNTAATLNWTPALGQQGTYTVMFTATSGTPGRSGSATTVITIGPADHPCVITAPATVNTRAEIPLTVNATVSDPDGDPITSLKAEGTQNTPLPDGMVFTHNANNTQGTLNWTPTQAQAINVGIDWEAVSGPLDRRTVFVTRIVVGLNRAPVVTAPASVPGSEGSPISFTVTASDPDAEAIASLTASGVPFGASFVSNPAHTSGTFNWTPDFVSAGTYPIVFTASNLRTGTATTNVVVADVNRAPTADADGPYSGVVGVPVVFNGSGSSDPDGNALAYAWDFGDGMSGSGSGPSHTYTTGGTFNVSLVVTDNGSPALSSAPSTTTAVIAGALEARLFTAGGGNKTIRLNSGKPTWCVQLEPIDGGFNLSDVVLGSLALRYGGNQVPAVAGKSSVAGDNDDNGVAELGICFAKADLRTLLAGLGNGHQTVTLEVVGMLTSGAPISGTIQQDVIGSGGALAGTIAPNPFNPDGVLTFMTKRAGNIRVRLYDASGRFVRTVVDQSAAAGYQDVHIDGRDERGNRLNTGVYFYRAETPDGAFAGRFTVLK